MKRFNTIAVLFTLALLVTASGFAQTVTVTGASGTAGPYTTLADAFTAINGTAQTGNAILITVSGTTTEPAIGAILNVGAWTTLTINPTGGAAATIQGAATAGLPLIDLNGADNVTVDGLNTGGNSLTIENTTASATSGTSTIRFIGGATTNTITKCSLKGAGSSSVATNGAIVFFSTDAVTASGNDNNTISNCDIGPSGANLPTKAILGNGSTTTTAIGNSGIVINNNNIFDYFGAAVTSAGVATNGGCNAWSITNNRFYQTGTRTWTTGALHNAINIGNTTATSGAQSFTITGNTIGYASNTQTGTYTLTGSTGSFRAIVFSGITAGVVSNINSNTIAAVSVTGVTSSGTSSSAPFMGIYVSNGVAITNSNTIGSQSATGSLNYATTSASAADVMGMFNFSVDAWTANSNLIGGITSSNAGAGAANAYGIRLNTSSTVATTLNGNTIGGSVANSIQSTSTATGAQVAGIFISTSIATVTSNTIRNLTNAGGTGTTTAASVVGIDFISATPVNTASQNTIFNLSNTNATLATTLTGIQFTGATGNVVARNLIYGISTASNSTAAEINGIRVAGGTTTYRNNMIAVGAGTANAIGTGSTTGGVNGINEPLGTDNFFHNSVYVGGAPTAGVGPSYAFNSSQTVNTRSFRDNIFFNARSNSGATGKNYAGRVGGTTPNPTGLTINNNVYFANGTGAVFGFFNSLDVADLAAWKTAVGQDVGSFNSNPQYNDPTNSTPDLHIHPTNATVAEGNGVDVGVTDDYDGQTRASFTPVDIGADAGNFNGVDLAPPAITYTALGNTSSTSDRVFPATITDVSGVNTTAGTKPRVYYKRTTDANALNDNTSGTDGWKYAEATNASSPFSFTINYSLLNGGTGVAIGQFVQYFVIAQDIAGTPNVGINSGSPAAPPSSVALTGAAFPMGGTINQYKIVAASLAGGDYTVGTVLFNRLSGKNITFERVVKKVTREVLEPATQVAQSSDKSNPASVALPDQLYWNTVKQEVEEVTWVPMENGRVYTGPLSITRADNPNLSPEAALAVYTTITAAVNDVSERGLTGPIRFLLTDATYPSETFPITINVASDNPTSATNTITIKPNTGVTASVSGAAASTSIFKVFNTNYVTIDGSNTVGGTTKDLTIENTSVTTPSVVWIGSSGTTPITNNVLKNCTVRNGVNTNSAVIISDGTTSGSAGYFSDITIQNNDVQKAFVGVFATGGTSPQNGANLTYTQNTVNTVGLNAVRNVGLYMQGVNGATVSQNTVSDLNNVDGENDAGIWLASGTINATVSNNTVSNLGYTGTSAFAPIGINVTPGVAGSNLNVTLNTVSNVNSAGTSPPRGIGSAVAGSGDITIQRNNIQGVNNTNTGTFGAYGIDVSAANNFTIQNNFISNVTGDMTGGAAFSTTFGIFGIRVGAGTGHKVYFNSVNLYGLRTGTATTSLLSAAFCLVGTTSTGCDVRNNIFANNMTGGTTSIAYVSAFLPSGGTSAMNLTWNNNFYYYGTDVARQGAGQAGTTAGTNFYTTLAAMAPYTTTLSVAATNDNASVENTGAPLFTSNTDLHLAVGSVDHTFDGVPIGGVTVDIDGDTRGSLPYKGADEVTGFPLPIQLAYLNAVINNNGLVNVKWGTVSEVNNYGFEVQKSQSAAENFATIPNSFVAGHGTTNEPHAYAFVDNTTQHGSWYYRLKQIDLDGTVHYTEPVHVDVLTSVVELAPKEFSLKQNYPNPFNPETTVKFSVENTAPATLEIYNTLGQKVATLFDGIAEAGQYYRVRLNGNSLATGMYIYKLQSGTRTDVKKMLLLK